MRAFCLAGIKEMQRVQNCCPVKSISLMGRFPFGWVPVSRWMRWQGRLHLETCHNHPPGPFWLLASCSTSCKKLAQLSLSLSGYLLKYRGINNREFLLLEAILSGSWKQFCQAYMVRIMDWHVWNAWLNPPIRFGSDASQEIWHWAEQRNSHPYRLLESESLGLLCAVFVSLYDGFCCPFKLAGIPGSLSVFWMLIGPHEAYLPPLPFQVFWPIILNGFSLPLTLTLTALAWLFLEGFSCLWSFSLNVCPLRIREDL